jgi:hypothetical protein
MHGSPGRRPAEAPLRYAHVDSASEWLLWIADVAAWCHGAGRDWRRRIDPIIASVTELD